MEHVAPTPPRKRVWLFRLVALSLTMLVLLLLAEGGARVVAKAKGKERTMAYDPELGWRPLPHKTKSGENWGDKRPITTNSRGWRDREHTLEKAPGTRRCLFLGDSFAFGLHVDDGERISDYLERDVAGLEVINISVSAWGPDQMLRALETEGLQYSPDFVVVLSVTWNDLEDIRRERNASWPKPWYDLVDGELVLHKPEESWDVRLRSVSYVAEFLYQHLHTDDMAELWSPGWEKRDALPLYEAIMGRIADHCRERNIPCAAVLGYADRSLPKGPNADERGMRAALEARGFLTCDTFAVFKERVEKGEELYWKNALHWNAKGHELAATMLRTMLAEHGVVP
jgi:hypothetical protein